MASYHRPGRLADALAVLGEGEGPWTILAGGTDIYPARVGVAVDDRVLDLTDIAGLRDITTEEGDGGSRLRIPALATWSDLLRADLPAAFDGLRSAARAIGGVQIQNRATVCGNVCNASPAADGMPNLLALDAVVEVASASGSRREVPIGSFVLGNRRTALGPDELVTGLLVPAPAPGTRGVFGKLGARAYLVISIVSVAVVVEITPDRRVGATRIVVGACSEVPVRLPAAEARLVGRPADPALAGDIEPGDLAPLDPIDDVRATADYRREAALVLVRRAVAEVLG